jgi:hypothetical protein
VKKINNETLKAIFTKGNQEDRRHFLVRLFGSLRFTAKITKRGHDGKTGVSVGVRGGADF